MILTGTTPLCHSGILSDDLTVPIVAFCSQFHVQVKNLPSLCISQFFSLSQAYESENVFWMSMPKIISIPDSLSQITKCVS